MAINSSSDISQLQGMFDGGFSNALNDIGDFMGFGSASRQRKYDYLMSSTAYQRAVSDMKAAGLNPAMFYQTSGGGASSPSGSTPLGMAINIIGQTASLVNSITNAHKVDNFTKSDELNRGTAKSMYDETSRLLKVLTNVMLNSHLK